MEICHSIDLMHVTKNVFDSIIGTLLGMPSKTKDGLKSRKTRDGNGYKPAGFCRPKPVPVKNIYAH